MEQRKSLKHSMLEHAALQQRSGKTLVSYANLIGVSRHKLQYWVRKYKASQKKVKIDTSLKFIDLGSFGLQEQPVKAGIPAASLETPAQVHRQCKSAGDDLYQQVLVPLTGLPYPPNAYPDGCYHTGLHVGIMDKARGQPVATFIHGTSMTCFQGNLSNDR